MKNKCCTISRKARNTKYLGQQHNIRYKLKQSPTMTTTTCRRCVSTKRCQLNVPALPRPRTPAESDNRPQTRHQHLHRVLEKRTPDKNQTPHFYKQWRTCEKMYFALDSALTSRANPTMPTTRRLGTHNMCFAAENQLDCLLPTTRFNCCRTAMFKHHPIKPSFGKQSLLPVSVAVSSRCRPASQPLTPCVSSRTFWLTQACVSGEI